ncbi:probable serine/threonine-protein kinase MARK-C isoform X2 [Malaya genurostris]|uniref:probable serine/threonine-protein kinase MARK-C isoform X2 n=1 Tax=Malaya genurostris TaxID=325434 RepID=UPI0026F3D794|nr:probable serine/threonine-protein kinase MARK-C isoform X2 [Malaya genurostris]XP_058457533.1 probable serine/threonine-protein kinase MARK-C isoform X2 [Malaya genurostris]XP_058457535.1 probable serine/threonine-protein kinase MARK-C isoform X2 [Malaya genurostris]
MIHVDETDPLGDVAPPFPYREVEIERGVDAKQLYELSTEIGRGKFGVVHTCKEKSTGIRLAAKFIQIVKKGDRKNIEREVHMMNVLRHPKIAQLYAAYEFDRTFCMVMELVEGGELFDRVLDEKFILTERACAIFMRQICEAIAYIHENNIVHLDLKPENILCLTESGNRIKIIDFGLAREYDPDNKLQVLFGTPEFVAPEVVNFEAISFATDMWSVGVIAYVLVSGLSPFAGEDDIQTMANITIGRYDFLDESFDNVSEEAIDFINRCLVKEQKDRITGEEALKHKWIKRKPQYYPTNHRPSITTFKPVLLENSTNHKINDGIDKENLKDLVSKWNENPNSRYTFDQVAENVISPSGEMISIHRSSVDAGGRRGSLARGDEEPLLLSPSSSTSCCSSSPPPSSDVSATNLANSESFIATPPPHPLALRPALVPLEVVPNTNSIGTRIGVIGSSIENTTTTSSSNEISVTSTSNNINNSSFNERSSPKQPDRVSPSDHSRPSFSDHSQTPSLHTTDLSAPIGSPSAVEVTMKPTKVKVCDELRKLSDLLKLSTTITRTKEEPLSESNTSPQNTITTLNNGSIPGDVTPLSSTLNTADLDTELESLKSKVKVIKTAKAQNSLASKQLELFSHSSLKLPTFKFLPKSISLCNDDSVFKENYTKFCDRNAIQKPSHLQESSKTVTGSSTTTTTTTSSQEGTEGTALIVTKTTKSSKTSNDGTKTITVRKTIVKQKKIVEQECENTENSSKTKLKPQPSTDSLATVKRTKFRVNQMSSRDVPVAINSVAKRYLEQNRLITNTDNCAVPKNDQLLKKFHKDHVVIQSETETTKNLKNTMKIRSLSVDWDAVEAVENRSMKSINNFLKRSTAASANSAVKQIQKQMEANIHK